MRVERLIRVLALATPLAACFDPPAPLPPPPENIFASVVDRTLVRGAMTDTAANPAALGARQFRQLVISDAPKGEWRAVCGQASTDGADWKDFIAIAQLGPAITALTIRGDQLTAQAIPACKVLVQKYLGERISGSVAKPALAKAGCEFLDPTYWWAWKSYCQGRLTHPAAAATP